jgi:hypothetical protein
MRCSDFHPRCAAAAVVAMVALSRDRRGKAEMELAPLR